MSSSLKILYLLKKKSMCGALDAELKGNVSN